MKNEKGITLLALVVTIIIILILSGIAIGALTGDNGLIQKAIYAKEQSEIAEEKEILNQAIVQSMGKNKYGKLEEEDLQKSLNNIQKKEGQTEVSKIRKKIVVKFTDTQRTYYVDNDGNVFEYTYTELSTMESGVTFSNKLSEYRTQILNVKVVDYLTIPDNAYKTFDVSQNQDGSVMAWLISNEEYYDLYIGGNDGVKTENCQNMFAYMENCLTIDLGNLYTENTTNFNYMFLNCKNLISVNLENLNTSEATSMNSMFNGCNNISEIDVSNFDTSNVKDMAAMFYGCMKLKEINLSNFITNKVTSMNGMFRQCYTLEALDLRNFDTTNLQRTDFMFYQSYKLKTIYVGNGWNNSKITLSDSMFKNCTSLCGAISYDDTKVDINYANCETGYFTYKMLDMS